MLHFSGIGFMAFLSNDTLRIKKNTGSFASFFTGRLSSDFSEKECCSVDEVDAVTNHKAGSV